MEEIIKRNGYKELHIEDFNNATWFCHLVLIYYKRFFCNKHKPENCSLRDCVKLKYMCRRNSKR